MTNSDQPAEHKPISEFAAGTLLLACIAIIGLMFFAVKVRADCRTAAALERIAVAAEKHRP